MNIIKNNLKIINYLQSIQKKFDYIIVSVISPILTTRRIAKKKFGNDYFEILTQCGIKKLIKRDTKGLYKLAKEKKINNLIGYKSKILYERSRYFALVFSL